jgi:hypothetical protein
MESSEIKKMPSFEVEYNDLMKGYQIPNIPVAPLPQWTKPSDFIVKFSLYQETPNSITSTETSVCL